MQGPGSKITSMTMAMVSAGVVLIMLALASYQTAPEAASQLAPKAGLAIDVSYSACLAGTSLSDTLGHADRALYALAAPFTL